MKFKEGDKIVALPNVPYGITTSYNGFGIVIETDVFKDKTGYINVRWVGIGVEYINAPTFIVREEHFKLMVKRWRDEFNE